MSSNDLELAAVIVVVVLIKLAIVLGGGFIAKSKGRSFAGWAIACLFFNWIALLIILLLPKKPAAAEAKSA